MSARETRRSTLGVYQDTKERFDRAKPFDSMSADEFVEVLLDRYETRVREYK